MRRYVIIVNPFCILTNRTPVIGQRSRINYCTTYRKYHRHNRIIKHGLQGRLFFLNIRRDLYLLYTRPQLQKRAIILKV